MNDIRLFKNPSQEYKKGIMEFDRKLETDVGEINDKIYLIVCMGQ